MKLNPKIDELLNSFVDGQLSTRQQTEVHRLAAHDPQVRLRLQHLQKCKLLVGSLPSAAAPAQLAENVLASLERKTLLGEQPSPAEQLAGARHLFIRKVLSVAAIIFLVALLSAIVYTIVSPDVSSPQPTATIATRSIPPAPGPLESKPAIMAVGFAGRLELRTSSFVEVDASISRAVADNDLLNCTTLTRDSDRSEYVLACTPKGLDLLLADLETIWPQLDSAEMFVQTPDFGRDVVVEAVTARQILEIARQQTTERIIRVAKDFAALNGVTELLPGKEVLAAIDKRVSGFAAAPRIPKPVLTGWPKTIKTSAGPFQTKGNVSLVITVLSGK